MLWQLQNVCVNLLFWVNFPLVLQVSNGDMTEAVAFLTEKNAQVSHQDETTYYQTSQAVTSDRYISVGSQADTSEQLGNICCADVASFPYIIIIIITSITLDINSLQTCKNNTGRNHVRLVPTFNATYDLNNITAIRIWGHVFLFKTYRIYLQTKGGTHCQI